MSSNKCSIHEKFGENDYISSVCCEHCVYKLYEIVCSIYSKDVTLKSKKYFENINKFFNDIRANHPISQEKLTETLQNVEYIRVLISIVEDRVNPIDKEFVHGLFLSYQQSRELLSRLKL